MKAISRMFLSMVLVGLLVVTVSADAEKPTPVPTQKTGTATVTENDFQYEENEDDALVVNVDGEETGKGEKFVFEINGEGSVVLNVNTGCSMLDQLSLKTNGKLSGEITVSKLENNPSETELKDVMVFCNVNYEGLDLSKVTDIEWKLVAQRQELSDKDIKKDDIELKLDKGDKWEKVKTKRTDGNNENYYYSATTKDFGDGNFAVVISAFNLFSLQNLLICLGAGFILLIAGTVVAATTQKKKK